MDVTNATCHTLTTIRPKVADLRAIRDCQRAAESPYCYPPNGTRLCVPISNVPIYWPQSFYHSDSKISFDYDLGDNLVSFKNNTGNQTQDFTPFMYDWYASETGIPHERSMQIHLHERRFDEEAVAFNIATYKGPEFILVQTAEFPSTTNSFPYMPTATGESPVRSSNNHHGGLSPGETAGIVLGALIVIALILGCCGCCGCCGLRTKKEREDAVERPLDGGEEMEARGITAQIPAQIPPSRPRPEVRVPTHDTTDPVAAIVARRYHAQLRAHEPVAPFMARQEHAQPRAPTPDTADFVAAFIASQEHAQPRAPTLGTADFAAAFIARQEHAQPRTPTPTPTPTPSTADFVAAFIARQEHAQPRTPTPMPTPETTDSVATFIARQEHAQLRAQYTRDDRELLPPYSKDDPPPYRP